MAANQRPVDNPVKENFEPSMEWTREPTADVLLLFLPGFKKEQLKVQVTSTSTLRISGEQPLGVNKWSEFAKELQIPSNCNINEISGKFERGTLSIRFPKNIAPAETQEPKPTAEAPKPQEQLPKQDLKQKPEPEPEPPTKSPIPQQPPQEKVQPLPESFPKPANDRTPQAPKSKQQEEGAVQEAAPKASVENSKIENGFPKNAAEEKKESPRDQEKHKSSVAADEDKTAGAIVSGSGMPELVRNNYKQVLGWLEKKMPKKINFVVVVSLVVVIVLSANSAIRYLTKI